MLHVDYVKLNENKQTTFLLIFYSKYQLLLSQVAFFML